MRHVIALDVGGTGMKAALVGADGKLLHEARRATARERGPAAVVEAVLDFAAELRAIGEERFDEPPSAAGIGVPGIVDEAGGVAVYSSNIGWRDVPFRRLLRRRLSGPLPGARLSSTRPPADSRRGRPDLPVAISHDLRAGGLAEARLGAGRGVDRFLFIALGTGIAAAIAIDGRIEAGAHGAAGEIGHIVVRRGPDGLPCGCGQRGCLETLASASAVGRAWGEACGDPEATAADAAKAVESGDPRAQAVWDTAVAALADGLVTGLTLLDPRSLIIGGGLAEAGDTLFAPLREAVRERVTFQQLPTIVPAALGDAAGCLGAGLLAWDLLSTEVTA
ncbi:ROK family protein [Streptomyces sp. H27-D2]|uniref:ROK family protein n=1 Tax=Streptomyces sp. H27-D2 TaxID=3046304 RepID=UPI002DBB5109|nr:ROK family protein [Streptomyces sp. H27-D2]MEC4020046.1 ROK family protein [Streptomyces sp. H27-D2]